MKNFFLACVLCLGSTTVSHADLPDVSSRQENIILTEGMHYLLGRGFDGSVVELENGAQFEIAPEDQGEVRRWKTYAILTISPNSYWFSDHDFLLTNWHTNTHVLARYSASPSLTNPFTYFVQRIHPWSGEMVLTDLAGKFTFWKIDLQDAAYARDWQPGDTVIVGHYDNWYSRFLSNKRYVLISYENSNRVKFVRADPDS